MKSTSYKGRRPVPWDCFARHWRYLKESLLEESVGFLPYCCWQIILSPSVQLHFWDNTKATAWRAKKEGISIKESFSYVNHSTAWQQTGATMQHQSTQLNNITQRIGGFKMQNSFFHCTHSWVRQWQLLSLGFGKWRHWWWVNVMLCSPSSNLSPLPALWVSSQSPRLTVSILVIHETNTSLTQLRAEQGSQSRGQRTHFPPVTGALCRTYSFPWRFRQQAVSSHWGFWECTPWNLAVILSPHGVCLP